MTIEQDIRTWALTRPAWQQELLVALSRGTSAAPEHTAELADRLLQQDSTTPSVAAQDLTLGAPEPKQVRLKRICNIKGVNALAEDQTLPFAPDGLTIIYGNNGSGKSSYARVIKAMVSARHSSLVLPHVYQDGAPDPSAELEYRADDDDLSEKFPADPPVPDLQRVRFYDEQCGDEYLSRESSVTYRPSALTLLDGLIGVCGELRDEIQRRITANQQRCLNIAVPLSTDAGAFLASLSANTTDREIDEACVFSSPDAERLGKAIQEVARLETSDATKERARLEASARDVGDLRARVSGLDGALSAARLSDISALRDAASAKRAAATIAASGSFEDEPLAGVGSETWRTLWRAARDYADSITDHNHEFPEVGDGARCVLCHQILDAAAKDRFVAFSTYMTDTTQRDAVSAEQAFAQALAGLRALDFFTPATTAALGTLNSHDAQLALAVQVHLSELENRRDRTLDNLTGDAIAVEPLASPSPGARLEEVATSLSESAAATDVAEYQAVLKAAKAAHDSLAASQRLSQAVPELKAETARRKELAELTRALRQTDTTGITRKATELTTTYATEQIRDSFTRETERMRLRRVTLKDLGGQKGRVRQIPALVGARHKDATARAVLSEGEQTVLGLAGFFTESEFDSSRSAVVFDDPVTSLDHVRRDKVADRLVELAKSRQVIVFTHDVAFVTDLLKSAGSAEVSVTASTIQHRGDTPGYVSGGFPWKAQDIGQRMNTIDVELTKLSKERQNLDDEAYEKRVNEVAGHLSETWERTVTSEIINRVYDRGRSEVRPQMLRMLARISEDDNKEYQEGYGHTSKWALRHDKSEETNYVPPEPDELLAEFERLRAWQKQIKKYQQQ